LDNPANEPDLKTSFLPRLVNGQAGDPALFVDVLREKRALLLDCGTLDALAPSELLRVTDVFVSHAHIDHFIGFDHLLRLHLGRGRRVRVFGPPGITGCIRGKLSGYTWNLVQRQRLVFEVHEWDGARQTVTEFLCRHKFRRSEARLLPASDLLFEDELIAVRAVALDHKIPSLAFAVRERDFYNIDPVALAAMGLRPGRWLNELKTWVRRGRNPAERILVEGAPADPAELAARLMVITPGRCIAYVADAIGSAGNVAAITALANQADLLFCEGAFLHEDLERAGETFHLTARQAGEIARQAGVKRLVVFHFSPKYEGRFPELEEEARVAFLG
jgi:ribonuclease Z